MAGEVHVHVSTVSPVQQSHLEAQDQLGGLSNTKSPLVAITTVVSTPTTPVCGPPLILSIPPRPTVTRGICLERQVILSTGIEALMQHYQAAGFSKEVFRLAAAPRRSSTNKKYDDKWYRFAHWATGQGFDLFGPTAARKAAFLYDLFDTHGLSLQTIKGYRFCLASVLSRTGKAAAVQAKNISDIIMSMELQRPSLTPVLPQWDLRIVLEALSEPPYEPLREASLRHLTLETVFLLSMASAGRCSELKATTIVDSHVSLQNSKSIPEKVKAHEVRALATSLQLFNKVDLQAVMKSWRWSSGATFTSFYLQDLCPQADSIRKTGPVVAAGEIVEISS